MMDDEVSVLEISLTLFGASFCQNEKNEAGYSLSGNKLRVSYHLHT